MAAAPPPSKPQGSRLAQALQPYICGGASAITASICIHPIDLVKVRIQLLGAGSKDAHRPSALAIAKNIIKSDGVSGLYSGLSAAVLRQAVYGTARLGLHRSFSNSLKEHQGGGEIAVWKKVGASMLSGAIASIIGNPFDIALVRMQADGMKPPAERRNYKNVVEAIMRIVREEGVVRLWRGSTPTVMRAMAMNVGMMTSYDQSREIIAKYNGDSISTQLLASAAAGFMCAFLSLPFDLLKTRLQNMKPDPVSGKLPYAGLADCATSVFRNEGIFAFWRGFGAYYGRCAPHAMIILIALEQYNLLYSSTFGTVFKK